MKHGLKTGLEHELARVVTREMCVLATRTPPVFATAEMIKLMEYAAFLVLEPFYEDNESSVGIQVDVHHQAATPLGMRVRAVARLTRIEGRRCSFGLRAYDEKEQIGQGNHERVIIDIDRFRDRLDSKIQ
jgi:fluoroacetyl-CoA thioesterase